MTTTTVTQLKTQSPYIEKFFDTSMIEADYDLSKETFNYYYSKYKELNPKENYYFYVNENNQMCDSREAIEIIEYIHSYINRDFEKLDGFPTWLTRRTKARSMGELSKMKHIVANFYIDEACNFAAEEISTTLGLKDYDKLNMYRAIVGAFLQQI